MSRLTVNKEGKYNIAYKDKGVHLESFYNANDEVKELVNSTNAVIQKLGEYEDLEEELGISFEVFIKAMLHGICIRINDDIMDFNNVVGWLWRFDRNPSYIGTERPLEYYFDIILGSVKSFYLKDYKKTWALNKEDFE